MTPADHDPRIWAVDAVRARFNAVAGKLEKLDESIWHRMAGAVRLYACLLRSSSSFFAVQLIRDRNQDRLSQPPIVNPARAEANGHPDLAILNDILRDELDNATETANLLRERGLEIISHADVGESEDTFLLGSEIVEQIGQKIRIMRAHWRDAELYFQTPNK
jgi:hypothetical protein